MTFNPTAKLVIDADPAGGRLLVRCPMWANDLVKNLPSRRWLKGQRAWGVPILRQNMDKLEEMMKLGGVEVTPAAKDALDSYHQSIRDLGTRGTGFPAWYRFKTEPRKHQSKALEKGYGPKGFALFMDMQTGKTKTSIDLCAAHRMEGHINAVIVFTKLTLRRNWVTQYAKHCPIPYSIYLPTTDKVAQFERWMARPDDFKIMVVGWESLSQGKMHEICDRFVLAHKCAVVGDETTYITSHKAGRAQHAVRIAQACEYRYALAGRPAMEGPMNLFMQFEFLDPNVIGIGDFYAYRNRYAVMGGFMREVGTSGHKVPTKVVGYQNLDELANLIAPFTFQVMKKDAYDLPPQRRKTYTVEMTKTQRDVYERIKKEGVLSFKGSEEQVLQNVLEVALRLHQVTGGYAVKMREVPWKKKTGEVVMKKVYDPVELIAPKDNPKMIATCEIMEELRGREQSLVWAVYMPEILALKQLFLKMGLRVAELHGGIKGEETRQAMVDEFNAGGFDVLLGNASTGGMGYTMQAATMNLFYNNTFKAIDRVQAEDRSYGDGQTKSGMWADIVVERSVDVLTMKALEAKMDVSEYVRMRIKQATNLLDGEE